MSTDGGVADAHGHSVHAHDFVVPELPEAVDIFDTILRAVSYTHLTLPTILRV